MSIIQDALKKVQIDTSGDKPKSMRTADTEYAPQPLFQKTPIAAAKRRPAHRNVKHAGIFLAVFIAAVAAGFTAKYFIYDTKTGAGTKKISGKEAKDAYSYQEVSYKSIPSAPDERSGKTAAEISQPLLSSIIKPLVPELVLNGIMYLEAGPRAIINDSIVGENEMVNGARVSKINKRSVVLVYNNVEVRLNLK